MRLMETLAVRHSRTAADLAAKPSPQSESLRGDPIFGARSMPCAGMAADPNGNTWKHGYSPIHTGIARSIALEDNEDLLFCTVIVLQQHSHTISRVSIFESMLKLISGWGCPFRRAPMTWKDS